MVRCVARSGAPVSSLPLPVVLIIIFGVTVIVCSGDAAATAAAAAAAAPRNCTYSNRTPVSSCTSFLLFFREPNQTLFEIGMLFNDPNGEAINFWSFDPDATVLDMMVNTTSDSLGGSLPLLRIPVVCFATYTSAITTPIQATTVGNYTVGSNLSMTASGESLPYCWMYKARVLYTVQPGDAIASIVEKTYQSLTSVAEITDENPRLLSNGGQLVPGQRLVVPFPCSCKEYTEYVTYSVRPGDTAASIANTTRANESDVRAAGNVTPYNVLVFKSTFPSSLTFFSPFGPMAYRRYFGWRAGGRAGDLIVGSMAMITALVGCVVAWLVVLSS